MRLDSLLSWARSLTLQQRSPNWVLNLQMAVWQWWRLSECSSKTVSCLAYQMSRGLQDVARRVHRCCKLLNFLSHFVSLVEASWSILKHWLRFDWLCMGWLEQLHWLPSSCIEWSTLSCANVRLVAIFRLGIVQSMRSRDHFRHHSSCPEFLAQSLTCSERIVSLDSQQFIYWIVWFELEVQRLHVETPDKKPKERLELWDFDIVRFFRGILGGKMVQIDR